jgi:hypothetical protein
MKTENKIIVFIGITKFNIVIRCGICMSVNMQRKKAETNIDKDANGLQRTRMQTLDTKKCPRGPL